MRSELGQIVALRLYLGGHVSMATSARVVERSDEGTLLWLAMGSPMWQVDLPNGEHLRDVLPEVRPVDGYSLRVGEWAPRNNLVYQPVGAAHAVWWGFSADMVFKGWYVNLEQRVERDGGIDVLDQELDILVNPDRDWRWKDEESFAAKIGHPAYWSLGEAERIRAEGERVTRLIEAAVFPFDGRWCDFEPPVSWGVPELAPEPPKFSADVPKVLLLEASLTGDEVGSG
ncbi:DUF402 domain-containing protein [Nonomuraea sediminis]|uniref:DUF402 domain-containing protein n=1 Tax=Nonomuraea sediminis TaxID=2835864 RepID=UPI001BDD5066|nr:DUF402 domain-containing protein [Nonomuraea sediminis]